MSKMPRPERRVAVETAELLLERHLRDERLGLGVMVGALGIHPRARLR